MARAPQDQRPCGARLGAPLRGFGQPRGERLSEWNANRDVEAAACDGEPDRFPFGGGDAHAGAATDAFAGLVQERSMGMILREAAACAGEADVVSRWLLQR